MKGIQMHFSLERFLESMQEKMKIFPDEYAGYFVQPVAAWISDDYVRVVFESQRSDERRIWGFKSDRRIHSSSQRNLTEDEVADWIYFAHIAGDYPALFNKSDGTHIDWRNTPGEGEPKTLAEVAEIPGSVQISQKEL